MPIHTETEIKVNMPDIIIKEKSKELCTRIDMTVPSERNFVAKEVEKISKCRDLEVDIGKIWDTKKLSSYW